MTADGGEIAEFAPLTGREQAGRGSRRAGGLYRWQVVALARRMTSEAVGRAFGRGGRVTLLAELTFGPSARGEEERREPPP